MCKMQICQMPNCDPDQLVVDVGLVVMQPCPYRRERSVYVGLYVDRDGREILYLYLKVEKWS